MIREKPEEQTIPTAPMTADEFRTHVRNLTLRAVNQRTYQDNKGNNFNVPDPEGLTPEDRAKVIDKLRLLIGT